VHFTIAVIRSQSHSGLNPVHHHCRCLHCGIIVTAVVLSSLLWYYRHCLRCGIIVTDVVLSSLLWYYRHCLRCGIIVTAVVLSSLMRYYRHCLHCGFVHAGYTGPTLGYCRHYSFKLHRCYRDASHSSVTRCVINLGH
jgi:hypothetical protein